MKELAFYGRIDYNFIRLHENKTITFELELHAN